MFRRKIMAAAYTSIFTVILLNIIEPVPFLDGGLIIGILVYSMYVIPIVFLYGIISSVLAERISLKAKQHRSLISLAFHILFGMAFLLPYGVFIEYDPIPEWSIINLITHPVVFLGIISSFIFFSIDFISKKRIRYGNREG